MNKSAFNILLELNPTYITINRYTFVPNSRGVLVKSTVSQDIELTNPVRIFLNNSAGIKDKVNNFITTDTISYSIAFDPNTTDIKKDDEFTYINKVFKVIQSPVYLITDLDVYGAYCELQTVGDADVGS
jgi:2-phosphoglycerate kinase